MSAFWVYPSRAAVLVSTAVLSLTAIAPADAQTKVNEKWITVVLPAEPPTLDGCHSSAQQQGMTKQNITESLIEKNPKDGTPMPRLATSWQQVDPSTWRVKLRQGVSFHDGSPFNAAAVKASIDRTMNTKLVCQDSTKFFTGLTLEVTAVDEYTVDIKTSQPDPIVPMRLTGLSIVGPKTPYDRLVIEPVGTGPYLYDSWQSGQQLLFRRNDKYWGAKPQAEGVRYVWRDETSVAAAMVKIGEADIVPIIAKQDAIDPQLDHSYLNSETTFLRIDVATAPLNDRRVRLALNYAMDREGMRGSILPKELMHATQLVIPSILGHNHDIDKKVLPYDPAKAKQLLAEAKAAGVPVDKEIMLYGRPSGYPNSAEVMEAFLANYKAIGLNVTLKNLEPGQYQELNRKPFAEVRQPALLQATTDNNSGDPVFTVPAKYGCKSATSIMCDPEFDARVAKVAMMTGQERTDGWREIHRYLYEEAVPSVFMYHMVGYARVSKRINYVPDITTASEIRIQEITFK